MAGLPKKFENHSREDLLSLSYLAEESNRSMEMISIIQKIIELAVSNRVMMNEMERNKFAIAYKMFVDGNRLQRSCISPLKAECVVRKDERKLDLIKQFEANIFAELEENCTNAIKTISDVLLPMCPESQVENRLFLSKMKSDMARYIAEVDIEANEAREGKVQMCDKYYREAEVIAKRADKHEACRLGLAVNFSVFAREVQLSVTKAIQIAEEALKDIDENLLTIDGKNNYQILTNNLAKWKDPSQPAYDATVVI